MKFNFDFSTRKKWSYEGYRSHIDNLMIEEKTTGDKQDEEMLAFTRMNIVRMNRWDKTAILQPQLLGYLQNSPSQTWIILSEAWCGDSAQNIPIIHKMAEASKNVKLIILLREQNLDIMDAFLTRGARSIPKLIAIDDDKEILFTWGPRPSSMQELVLRLKSEGKPYSEELHKMYAKDKAKTIQKEFISLLS